MISAVSNYGDMQFMIFEGAMNVDIFKDFITRLISDIDEKVFLIVDNLRVHHAKCLEPWLMERKASIEIFYLPSYSPELNPDEYLNRDLKANISEQARPKTKTELHNQVKKHLEQRKKDPKSIKQLFKKKEVLYAAD